MWVAPIITITITITIMIYYYYYDYDYYHYYYFVIFFLSFARSDIRGGELDIVS